jgi:hypothetical protein
LPLGAPVFVLRDERGAKTGASDWNRTSDLGLMSPTL